MSEFEELDEDAAADWYAGGGVATATAPVVAVPSEYFAAVSRDSPPPVVVDPEWLPPDPAFEELNELRANHVRLCNERARLSGVKREIVARHEAEDAAIHAVRKLNATTGKDTPLPEITPAAEREAELADATPRVTAVIEALLDAVDKIVLTVATRAPDWVSDLDAIEAGIEERIARKRRELDEIKAEAGATTKLRHWLDRTAKGMPGYHLQYTAIPTPGPPCGTPAHQKWQEDLTYEAYGDGLTRRLPGGIVAVRNPDPDGETDWLYRREGEEAAS